MTLHDVTALDRLPKATDQYHPKWTKSPEAYPHARHSNDQKNRASKNSKEK